MTARKPRPVSVWLVESQWPDGSWRPDLDRRPCRTKALAADEAKFQNGGALKGLVRYRPAKYVRK